MYLNKVQIVGRLVRDPEIKYLTSGKSVCTFTLANSFKDKPEYFNCEAWDKLGEATAEHCEQGQEAYVEGHLQTSTWEKDGVKHARTKIVVERISFGPKKSREPGQDDEKWNYGKPEKSSVGGMPATSDLDDDVPF